jgi:hypothetical protein
MPPKFKPKSNINKQNLQVIEDGNTISAKVQKAINSKKKKDLIGEKKKT